ncbi:hypothetical protein DL89DRAFT_269136 [Linderina pennispora]|uniref:DUF3074 domain-containing protein n=1 Tax=Linderina pennispora TaxID=61395 RepID=A0A1Y1W3T8_9FUNG|nr:uncharacterized protein DL89DRAFT_269136 [Linderina pennispora]ORX67975.1 hypothetical protein DL89DRAFT_269136 [Linderina pennispora]
MVLKPIRRSVIPSPLENSQKFDEFITQYFNKCDDLLSYTPAIPVQRQNRNPNEDHRWLRRDVYVTTQTSYDELKSILFLGRADHLPQWMPSMVNIDAVEALVPNVAEVFRYCFKSGGLKAKRDYCQLVLKREFLGEQAHKKPRIFTPSMSMTNLANMMRASQSTTNLGIHSVPTSPLAVNPINERGCSHYPASLHSPESPKPFAQQPHHQQEQSRFVGLNQASQAVQDDDDSVVTVPIAHSNCTEQRGYVRAFYETYEEVREYSNGDVEWSCIHHSDFSGWIPSFMADKSIATGFPKEADALLAYVQRVRTRPLHNEY